SQEPPGQARLDVGHVRQLARCLDRGLELALIHVQELRVCDEPVAGHLEIANNGPVYPQGLRHLILAGQRKRCFRRHSDLSVRRSAFLPAKHVAAGTPQPRGDNLSKSLGDPVEVRPRAEILKRKYQDRAILGLRSGPKMGNLESEAEQDSNGKRFYHEIGRPSWIITSPESYHGLSSEIGSGPSITSSALSSDTSQLRAG